MFFEVDEFEWHQPPGHFDSFSRYVVNPDNTGSAYFDFRFSRIRPHGHIELHVHEVAEHVYYFTAGVGEARCGEETRTVRPGSIMFVPPGVVHAISCDGPDDLCFVVVTSPPTDIAR
jgi:mannose-6-phosphate isomerase-like protein (cupin superfamily)